jgi:hypothetical protein
MRDNHEIDHMFERFLAYGQALSLETLSIAFNGALLVSTVVITRARSD